MMRSFIRAAVAVFLALAGFQATAAAQAGPKSDRNLLTSEEIRALPVSSVHNLIRSRRANWLSTRGPATLQTRTVGGGRGGSSVVVAVEPVIVVYVDNIRRGGAEILRSLSTEDVESIERLDAMKATQRFGTGHEYGAIVIRGRTR